MTRQCRQGRTSSRTNGIIARDGASRRTFAALVASLPLAGVVIAW
jgi:hypothetical protein